jgi:hypothetical protein
MKINSICQCAQKVSHREELGEQSRGNKDWGAIYRTGEWEKYEILGQWPEFRKCIETERVRTIASRRA